MNDLDWEHVIEEVEDVCGSQLSAVKSHLGLITMLHALKALAWPEHPAVEHWQQEVAAFLANAQDGFQHGFQLGMQQHIDPADIYARALKRLRKLPPMGGVPPRPLAAVRCFHGGRVARRGLRRHRPPGPHPLGPALGLTRQRRRPAISTAAAATCSAPAATGGAQAPKLSIAAPNRPGPKA